MPAPEASIAHRELALVRARNRLEAAQFRLIDILELDSRVRIRPLEALQAGPQDAAVAPALEDVLHGRADCLQAMLRVDVAGIALSVVHDDLLPDLALSFQWARDDTGRTQNQVRMDATVPLNDRGPATRSRRRRDRPIPARSGPAGDGRPPRKATVAALPDAHAPGIATTHGPWYRASADQLQFPVTASRLTITPSMSNASGGIP